MGTSVSSLPLSRGLCSAALLSSLGVSWMTKAFIVMAVGESELIFLFT